MFVNLLIVSAGNTLYSQFATNRYSQLKLDLRYKPQLLGNGQQITLASFYIYICDRIWEKGPLRAKRDFLPFFKLSPFQGLKSPRLLTWFIGSIGLLLHRSNVKSYSKASVPSGEPPKWGIKRRFSNAIDAAARPAHTGNGRGSEFLASVAGWWKNIHTKVQVHSCYGSRDISVLKWKFGNSAKWSLFSDPVTYIYMYVCAWGVMCTFSGVFIVYFLIIFMQYS